MVFIVMLKFIIILKRKTLYLYIINKRYVSFLLYTKRMTYRTFMKEFLFTLCTKFQMSRGTVERPSSNTLSLGQK